MSETPDPQTLVALLDQVAARRPAAEAFISPRRRAIYAELRDDSIAIGRGLAACGVGRGTRVENVGERVRVHVHEDAEAALFGTIDLARGAVIHESLVFKDRV